MGSAPALATPAQINTTVLQQLSVVNTVPLNFGDIIPGVTTSDIQIHANTGARARLSGDAILVGGGASRGTFMTSGPSAGRIKLDVQNGFVQLTRVGGTETMRLSHFTLNMPTNQTLPASGVLTFHVGGRLRVNPNQVAGTYAGTYDVTVNFR